MKTRRSWRNQDRLWKELGGKPAPVCSAPAIPRCWNCVNYPKGGRSRGRCSLHEEIIQGRTENRPCFKIGLTCTPPYSADKVPRPRPCLPLGQLESAATWTELYR
mgnify:CR=1 FL=1